MTKAKQNEPIQKPDQLTLPLKQLQRASHPRRNRAASSLSSSSLVSALAQRLGNFWLRHVICRANEVCYWRHKGWRIGENCSFHSCHLGSEPWLIEIGDHVVLARGVSFLTHDGSSRVFRHLLPEASTYGNRYGTIQIHDNSFIGVNAIILPDVEIGPNSIVGAGSVVSRDVAPDTVVAGVPASRICSLQELVEKYKDRMIPIAAENRTELRKELTRNLWGEIR